MARFAYQCTVFPAGYFDPDLTACESAEAVFYIARLQRPLHSGVVYSLFTFERFECVRSATGFLRRTSDPGGEARGPRETTSAHGLECVLHCPLGPLSHTDNTYKKKCSTSVNMFCLLVDLGEQSERSAAGSC